MMSGSVMSNPKIHCNKKDMDTLLLFKQGLTDPSGMLSSWISNLDCCQWTGVKCHNITDHLEVIDFLDKDDKSHCLTGTLSLSLLELQSLSYLNLSNNNFKFMQYTSMYGNSTNLQYLDLSLKISHLTSLQYLNLGGVYLHKDIDWLQPVTMLPSLKELHLKCCELENIYPYLQHANFTSLQVLNLADNRFMFELPNWLFNLSCEISRIDLSQNQIHSQLPKSLPNFKSLESLVLCGNNLKGPIPSWLGQLEQLQELDLSHNLFSGPIPTSLGNLSSLIKLMLESNVLNGNLPVELGQLFKLETLRVSNNPLTGIVSEKSLRSLRNLKNFSLSSPFLIFDFDAKWVPPFQLLNVELGYLRDKLPAWLFRQSSLKYLTIRDSTASFEPLDMFWNFTTQLEYISLENNTINGDMSKVFLSSKVVWLVANNLRGGMPRISPEVVVLHLRNNSLSGSISPLLCHNMRHESNLVYLDLSYNNLSGELTDCWNNWKSLVLINLRFNNLTGEIPRSLGSLSNLRFLYLKSNKFFGKVPFSLRNCKNLRILDLCRNNLSGVIPTWLGQKVEGLELRSNQFSGNIPTQLCQLRSLMIINLASNKLSGPIPNCLQNITAMNFSNSVTRTFKFTLNYPGLSVQISCSIHLLIKGNELPYFDVMNAIDLSSNNLSGSVPLGIYMLTGLQSLNLSHNQLIGTIPNEIGKLQQLESIDLSSNNLSGEIPQSMSALHFLGVLNLSFNNFMGKIPAGTQLGSTNLSYIHNPDLCGPPLTKICPPDEHPNNKKSIRGDDSDDDKFQVHSWFHMGLGMGFAAGFWGLLGTVFFNRKCRRAYFKFLNRISYFVIQKINSITEM
ncbi:hypothetical protein V8G54_029125 [Vigna mungo]|uniref:Leucine-rich repeat-containing N-terminal plant-type domain-containing protein n=1 Tax=Vigna mungo TaxID=3915 RepID=A0AAQ3MUN1_VIGMU